MEYKTFCIDTKTMYVERSVSHELFNKFYEIINPEYEEILSIPDGCVNIWFLWNKGECQTRLIGSAFHGKPSLVSNYERCFGIKFHSGIAPLIIQRNIKDIINNNCLVNKYLDLSYIENNLTHIPDFNDKVDFIMGNNKCFGTNQMNGMVAFLLQNIHGMAGNISVADLASISGYSASYVNRVFKNTLGMPVKKYSCIVRAQNSILGIEKNDKDFIYEKLGYYDQAHFIKDFKRYTLLTPKSCQEHSWYFV